MKRISVIAYALLLSSAAWAQDVYEAVDMAASDLNGTARYVGMGGALGALGGDITTMGTNPAGTALFRHNEAALGFSAVFTKENGQLGHDATRASFDHAGIIFAMDQSTGDGSGLQYINFGINYVKNRNHLGNIHVPGVAGLGAGDFSQTWQVAGMANDAASSGISDGDWPVLADIFAPTFTDGKCNDDGAIAYDPALGEYYGFAAADAAYRRATYGSNSQFDFNLSFNVSNQFFWGLSLGVYSNDWKRESLYGETGKDGNYYDLTSWYDSKADGFDVKLGFICRPFADSPFRFGLSVNTPIWYKMDDVNGWSLRYTDVANSDYSYQASGQAEPFRYSYRTPWKFGVSLGHTVGRDLAFGLEYNYSDPSAARYYNDHWDNTEYFSYVNEKIGSALKPQHTLKMGVEYKVLPEIALRLGYNYVSSPIKSDAFRLLDYWYDTYQTETAFINWKDLHRLTFGFGYRFKGGFFDLAFQYNVQKGDLYAFDGDYTDAGVAHHLAPTSINNDRGQILGTLGFTF